MLACLLLVASTTTPAPNPNAELAKQVAGWLGISVPLAFLLIEVVKKLAGKGPGPALKAIEWLSVRVRLR